MSLHPTSLKYFIFPFLLITLILPAPGAAAGDEPSDVDLSFLDGLSLVVLEDGDIPSMHEARRLIESSGGRVAVMSPPSLLVGWVPYDRRESLLGRAGIRDVYFTEVPEGELSLRGGNERAMVSWFNAAVRGEMGDRLRFFEQPLAPGTGQAPPRLPDMKIPPAFDGASVLDNLRSVGLDGAALEAQGLDPGGIAAYGSNSLYMTGTIALTIFFVESDGSGTDPDQYTWTVEDMQSYLDGAATGMVWWAARAASHTGCSATFLLYWHSAADPRCQQWVEPLLHDTSYEDTWVKAIMANFGYASGTRFSRVDAFNTWQRSTYQTARAYSAFICYNPYPSPMSFPDNHTAYAWYHGPYFVSLFRTGWTKAQTFSHESGHIFGACDEYAGGCSSSSCTTLCNGVENANCEVCNSRSVACMMKANSWSLCAYTPGQLGWNNVPCTPTPPPPLPAPAVTESSPAALFQGLSGTVTVVGTNFYAGAHVDLGPSIFVHNTTLAGAETLTVDVTVLNDAPPGSYDVTVRNRDFQESTLAGALQVMATTRHYFSPSGAGVFPYITPADAAGDLEEAIAAAYGGDTLFVPSMTMTNFSIQMEKGVLLYGAWNADFTARDLVSGKTVLDLAGDVSFFPGAENGGMDGFIVQNGDGQTVITPFAADAGGGIRVINTAVTISNCEIRNNAATGGTTLGIGGGIFADSSNVDFHDNYIHDNTATWGGGVFLHYCTGTMSGNTISGNAVQITTDSPHGAGVYLINCGSIQLADNTIENNTGAVDGGGILSKDCSGVVVSGGVIAHNASTFLGGGIAARKSVVTLDDVLMHHNNAPLGAAVGLMDTSDIAAAGCRFMWNSGALGGGIYASGNFIDISHNLFVGNSAAGSGGSIYAADFLSGLLAGNSVDRSTNTAGSGAVSVVNSAVEIFNNIVVNSSADGILVSGSGSPWVAYNHVWNSGGDDYNGTAAGDGATTGDPVFADTSAGDYHLGPYSPAIDSGRPGPGWQDPDGSPGDKGWYGSHEFVMEQPVYPKNLTAAMESGSVVLRWDANPEPDIGWYAVFCDTAADFTPSADNLVTTTASGDTSATLEAPGDSVWYAVGAVDTDGYAGGYSGRVFLGPATAAAASPRYHTRLDQNVPNPFNPVTRIGYRVGEPARVTLTVYDVAGRRIRRLVDGPARPGVYTAVWDGTNDSGAPVSSGIYFYRLHCGSFEQTRKMLILK